MNPLLHLYQSAMTVSVAQWHLLSAAMFFLINAVFCGHNIAGIKVFKIGGHKRIKNVLLNR